MPLAWLARLFLGWGAPSRLARPLAIAALLVLIVGALWLSWSLIERGIRRDERAKIEAQDTKAALDGERRAGSADERLRRDQEERANAIEGAIDNAIQREPEAAARPVGPATGAALDELRRRRAAR